MKKKNLALFATIVAMGIGMNLKAQNNSVVPNVNDKSITPTSWSRSGDNVGGTTSNRLGSLDGYPIRFCTKDIDRIYIDTTGKVGINTLMPLQKLHVLDGNILISRSATDELGSENGTIYFGDVVNPNQPFGKWGIEYVSSEKEGYGLNFWKPWVSGQSGGNFFLFLADNGNVGVGTNNPQKELSVNGTVLAKEVIVSLDNVYWPDYVFSSDYSLLSLEELESYVKEYHHLPGVPSSDDVKDGVCLGELNKALLEKVEILTLYIFEMQKQLEVLKQQVIVKD